MWWWNTQFIKEYEQGGMDYMHLVYLRSRSRGGGILSLSKQQEQGVVEYLVYLRSRSRWSWTIQFFQGVGVEGGVISSLSIEQEQEFVEYIHLVYLRGRSRWWLNTQFMKGVGVGAGGIPSLCKEQEQGLVEYLVYLKTDEFLFRLGNNRKGMGGGGKNPCIKIKSDVQHD